MAIIIDDDDTGLTENDMEIVDYDSHPSPTDSKTANRNVKPASKSTLDHCNPPAHPLFSRNQLGDSQEIGRSWAWPISWPDDPTRSRRMDSESRSHLELARSFALSPSPMSGPSASSKMGTANDPIELTDNDCCAKLSTLKFFNPTLETKPQNNYRSCSLHSRYDGGSLASSFLSSKDDDEAEETENSSLTANETSALYRSMRRRPTVNDVLIDLECLENIEHRWSEEPDLQILQVEDLSHKEDSQNRRKSFKQDQPPRNPPISEPFVKLDVIIHRNITLRPSKTVELFGGDFLRIKDMIRNSKTNEVILRGSRFQRCKDLNGMLERKLNEVCLCYEIDLDDPREPHEQSVIEVPVADVKRLRNLRWTNQNWPNGRAVTVADFQDVGGIRDEGGLTVRWKYTCIYATASHRYRNAYIERTLEHIKEDESTSQCETSDDARRFEWRGETIRGGAYLAARHGAVPVSRPEHYREKSPISIASSDSETDASVITPSRPSRFSRSLCPSKHDFRQRHNQSVMPGAERKRKCSSPESVMCGSASKLGQPSKKSRSRGSDSVDKNGQHIAKASGPAILIDLSTGTPKKASAELTEPPITPMMQILLSDLATPPPSGTIRSSSSSAQSTFVRPAGQMLTYGDAFCGAGGSTRGAAMAGLRVMWGFDFNAHACSTWQSNFPTATCYNLASHQFVQVAQGTTNHPAVYIKVDILHLSPPCQFFSPAHTVDGVDDEMNVASLFAVAAVISVARPRVATLEQTFGIVSVRFRFYFSALIQMFSSLNFSVRWAIVPLAQWGLPQRRFRLIIIASCPGEVLPSLPAPTHSEKGEDGLKTFITVNDTISSIPNNSPDHNPFDLVFVNRRLKPWDGNKILPRTMTTSGGQNYHPSGTRDFTLREYASLQGFPPNHVFRGSYIKKQIGNAVPPCIAKVLFESIKRDLDKADGVLNEVETLLID